MRKIVKIILVVLISIVIVITALFFLVMRGIVSLDISNTFYEGYVEIEPISLSELKTRLKNQGCQTIDYKKKSPCLYEEIQGLWSGENGIEVHPHGVISFNPTSIYITENKIWADKDISGSPNTKKFKEAIKKNVESIGNIVKIKEDTYKITKIKYPWNVYY